MPEQNARDVRLHIKKQTAKGTAATGAGATGLIVTPGGSGVSQSIARIESQLVNTNRMRRRPRSGTKTSSASYNTEAQVGPQDVIYPAILGATDWTAAAAFSNTDWGALTISGTGVTLTFATGTILTDGITPGCMARLTNMSEAGNNSKWFPILACTEGVITTITGILEDTAEDAAWNIEIAKRVSTADPYVDSWWTIEELWPALSKAKLSSDNVFNRLAFGVQADRHIGLDFALGGVGFTADDAAFTSPVFGAGRSLVLHDGLLITNGTARTVTSFTLGIEAGVSYTPAANTTTPYGPFLGEFGFIGEMAVALESVADYDLFAAETAMAVWGVFREQGGPASESMSVFAGDVSFGGFTTPATGEPGALIATIALYGGSDENDDRAASSLLVSSSAA